MARTHFKRRAITACLFLSISTLNCSNNLVIDSRGISVSSIKNSIEKYQSPDWEQRLIAVKDLKNNIKGPNDQLVEMALIISSRDTHPSVRIESLNGLENLATKKSIDRMNEMALSDESLNVRWQALRSLVKIRDESSYSVFMQSFSSDDWLIREAAIQGILLYSSVAGSESLAQYSEKGLKDINECVKIATLRNLQVKEEMLYPLVLDIFKKHKKSSHPLLNASLVALKGYMLDKETRDDVIDLLGHKNREIRILAFRVLKQEITLKNEKEQRK